MDIINAFVFNKRRASNSKSILIENFQIFLFVSIWHNIIGQKFQNMLQIQRLLNRVILVIIQLVYLYIIIYKPEGYSRSLFYPHLIDDHKLGAIPKRKKYLMEFHELSLFSSIFPSRLVKCM